MKIKIYYYYWEFNLSLPHLYSHSISILTSSGLAFMVEQRSKQSPKSKGKGDNAMRVHGPIWHELLTSFTNASYYAILWTPHFVSCVSHSKASSILIWKMILFIKKNDLESPLIFVLFLKSKQNKKENPKCDSLLWKKWSVKNRIGFEGQVTYQEGTVRTVAPL